MEKSFDDFWNGFNNPTTPLACTVVYIRDTTLEDADVEMLEEFVLRWEQDNTDPTGAEECAISEIELYIHCASEAQELAEMDREAILNEECIKEKLIQKVEKDKIISIKDFLDLFKK